MSINRAGFAYMVKEKEALKKEEPPKTGFSAILSRHQDMHINFTSHGKSPVDTVKESLSKETESEKPKFDRES